MGGKRSRRLWAEGDLQGGVISCGQGVGLIRDIPSVEEFVDRLVTEAQGTWEQLGRGYES